MIAGRPQYLGGVLYQEGVEAVVDPAAPAAPRYDGGYRLAVGADVARVEDPRRRSVQWGSAFGSSALVGRAMLMERPRPGEVAGAVTPSDSSEAGRRPPSCGRGEGGCPTTYPTEPPRA